MCLFITLFKDENKPSDHKIEYFVEIKETLLSHIYLYLQSAFFLKSGKVILNKICEN